MHVKIIRSPDRKKKFRAILGDGRTVDFGASGYSDYTKHKTPSRMRSMFSDTVEESLNVQLLRETREEFKR